MSGLCSSGYAFDTAIIQAVGFTARCNRIRLGEMVRRRRCFTDATNESAGESVQRMLGLSDFEIASMSDQKLGWLSDVVLDLVDDFGSPERVQSWTDWNEIDEGAVL